MEGCVRPRACSEPHVLLISSPLPLQGRGQGEGFVARLIARWKTPHLNPLPFVKGRGGFSVPHRWTSALCCWLAVNHGAWAGTKLRFSSTGNLFGKYSSTFSGNWNRRKFLFRQEPIRRGGLATFSL